MSTIFLCDIIFQTKELEVSNLKKYTVCQTVNNQTLDVICNRYNMCGWKEIDILGSINCPTEVIFEREGEGLPNYPSLSDI